MILETWVAVLIVLFIFAMAFVCAIGWLIRDHRYDEACEEIRKLNERNQLLVVKNAKLGFELNLMRAKIESEAKR